MAREVFIISHSDQESRSRCEWAHHYGYGYRLTPKKQQEHTQIGLCGHEMLAGYYTALKNSEPWEDAVEAGLEVWQEIIRTNKYDYDAIAKAKKLYDRYVEAFDPWEWEILWVEEYMEYQLTDELILNGVIDLVVRAKTGRLKGQIGVIDHKFVLNFMMDGEVETHAQTPKYAYCLNRLGIFDKPITFTVLNQVRYREMKNPSDDMLFARYVLTGDRLTETLQASFINEHIKQSKRIMELRRLEDPYFWKDHSGRTTIKDICKWCDYRLLCVRELKGLSIETESKVQYKKRDLSYRDKRVRVNGVTREISE